MKDKTVSSDGAEPIVLNMNGLPVTIYALAQIATLLEEGKTITVGNAVRSNCGGHFEDLSGMAACDVGTFMAEALHAKKDGKW